ncbi:MAG: hypothetical protein ACJAYU_000732 [Bradymonadia bacterium]
MASLGERAKLVYIDPPFAAARDFDLLVSLEGAKRRRVAFSDKWSSLDAYMAFMREVLTGIHGLLDESGSLLLHCDHRAAPYLAVACDEIFGLGDRGPDKHAPGFRNEIIWSYGLGGSSRRCYPKKHDSIFWYTKSGDWHFDPPMVPATSQRMAGQLKKATDVFDVASLNNMAKERTGYPTQKPLALLERFILAHTEPGDLVVDLFSGSGTTATAAAKHGRRAIVSDIGADAIDTTLGRLLEIGASFEFRGDFDSEKAPARAGQRFERWDPETPLEAVFSGTEVGEHIRLTGYADWRGVETLGGDAHLIEGAAKASGNWVYLRDANGRRWHS